MSDHTYHGKWSQPGVAHHGWTCIGMEDLGSPSATCEMCESVTIRYVHTMQHPEYPYPLGVGCVCAENMEEDYVNPRLREKTLKTTARKTRERERKERERLHWEEFERQRKEEPLEWRTSSKGNPYANIGFYNVAVFPTAERWSLRVALADKAIFFDSAFATKEDAKKAAKSAVALAKEPLGAS